MLIGKKPVREVYRQVKYNFIDLINKQPRSKCRNYRSYYLSIQLHSKEKPDTKSAVLKDC